MSDAQSNLCSLLARRKDRMKQLTDLLANYPAFATALEAFPEATEAVISADLPADLAAERDILLLATAQLWQAWRDLGAAIAMADRPTIIQ